MRPRSQSAGLVALCLVACLDDDNLNSSASPVLAPAPVSIEQATADPPLPLPPAIPAGCDDEDPLRELFRPTLPPGPPKAINPRNSASHAHRARERIVRVEVAHARTHRHLFDLDAEGLAGIRVVPDYPPLRLRARGRPAGGPNWPVVLLIYVENEDLPYLGHPVSDELYFAEDMEPWDFHVWADDGKGFRDIFPMPLGHRVYAALSKRLGHSDPDGKAWSEARAIEDARCGRKRVVSHPEEPRAFPNIPRAVTQ